MTFCRQRIRRKWSKQQDLAFLISEKTFSRLDEFPKQIFQVSFCVDAAHEEMTKEKIKTWLRYQNVEFRNETMQDNDLFYLVSKSDIVKEQKDYIEANRIIMGMISLALLSVGIINYLNTMITGILIRKREFAAMECIGMTKKQIRRMIKWEGMVYFCFIMMFLLSIGLGLLLLFGKIMKHKISYFVFVYPSSTYLIIAFSLYVICAVIPQIIYGNTSKEAK